MLSYVVHVSHVSHVSQAFGRCASGARMAASRNKKSCLLILAVLAVLADGLPKLHVPLVPWFFSMSLGWANKGAKCANRPTKLQIRRCKLLQLPQVCVQWCGHVSDVSFFSIVLAFEYLRWLPAHQNICLRPIPAYNCKGQKHSEYPVRPVRDRSGTFVKFPLSIKSGV